jgi:hypothetical protein
MVPISRVSLEDALNRFSPGEPKEHERRCATTEASISAAMSQLMVKRLAHA